MLAGPIRLKISNSKAAVGCRNINQGNSSDKNSKMNANTQTQTNIQTQLHKNIQKHNIRNLAICCRLEEAPRKAVLSHAWLHQHHSQINN